MTFTGDVLIAENFDGDIDIQYENGQPIMTDGFESYIMLAVFGEDGPWNGMTTNESEKLKSTFPSVIHRATVSDETREDGRAALESALASMVTDRMASKVTVTGSILSVNAIGWEIDIDSPNGNGGKYEINWEKGSLTAGYRRIA